MPNRVFVKDLGGGEYGVRLLLISGGDDHQNGLSWENKGLEEEWGHPIPNLIDDTTTVGDKNKNRVVTYYEKSRMKNLERMLS